MRIGSYNIFGLKGYPTQDAFQEVGNPGTMKNSSYFIQVFNELSCEILALQEGVAVGTIQKIARGMGQYLATFPSPGEWPGHVLSQYPLLESRTFSHSSPIEESPVFGRTAGAALLEVDNGVMLWIVDLHLSPGDKNLDLRVQEADLLLKQLEGLSILTNNIIVLGDFNSQVDEKVHQDLKGKGFTNAMEEIGGGLHPTVDTAGKHGNAIDHIYLSPTLRKYLQSAIIFRGSGFRYDGPQKSGVWVNSDHLPVVVQLDWP